MHTGALRYGMGMVLWLTSSSLAWSQVVSDGRCRSWEFVEQMATLELESMVELSGIQVGRMDASVLWVHNDAGNPAEIFGLDKSGEYLGSVTIAGVENEDWEDLSIGPCMDSYQQSCSCLYIADTGSGSGERREAVIYRVEEPDPADGESRVPQSLWFRYPDTGHDAEAILVHPITGETLVITKNVDGPAQVFAFPDIPPLPAPESDPQTLRQVALLELAALESGNGAITGASVSPLGHRIVLRTEEMVYGLEVGSGSLESAFEQTPTPLFSTPSTDGEAIGFDSNGDALWMVDEGESSPLWFVACEDYEEVESSDEDPLLDCDWVLPAEECGCSGRQALGILCLPLFGWSRRRRNFPR